MGGKWTTYRKMAADVIDQAQAVCGLGERPCPTEHLAIHGATATRSTIGGVSSPYALYGSDAPALLALTRKDPQLGEPLHPDLPYTGAEVVWACRHEMPRTVEDMLARRTRALLLDARASIVAAPRVAALMATELGRDANWIDAQVAAYTALARGYVLA